MRARADRNLTLLALTAAAAAAFLLPMSAAQADDGRTLRTVPGRSVSGPVIARSTATRPTPPRTLPVARSRVAIPEAARPMTASQMAATHGLTYRDAGTFVLLEGGTLRVRIYPGTSTVVIAGREYRVKDPALRSQRAIVLSKRVAGFLNHKIGSYRADERVRSRIHRTSRPRYEPLPPLPPKPVRRAPKPMRVAPKPKPEPKPVAKRTLPVTAEPGWIPRTSERKWRWIVLHHSDDLRGNLAKYDDYHRNDRRWEHGCGYHFVIGNGSLSRDGEIEVGPRWARQLHGAHAKTPDNRFNDYGIGISLVGKFNESRPSRAQMDSLVKLVRWLKDRYGVEPNDVRGHCDCCPTDCPGKNFPWAELRRRVGQ